MGGVRENIMCMEKIKKYNISLSIQAKRDIKQTKSYIIWKFKYRSYAEKYLKEIKKVILSLEVFPEGYEQTEFEVRGSGIYYKPYKNYLIFYIIENTEVCILRIINNRMNWKEILKI